LLHASRAWKLMYLRYSTDGPDPFYT
jgi:hypothetical protein